MLVLGQVRMDHSRTRDLQTEGQYVFETVGQGNEVEMLGLGRVSQSREG